MIATTKAARDERRAALENSGAPKFQAEHMGKQFDVYLVPANQVPPELPMAIAQFTPTQDEWEACSQNPAEVFFMLSDRVPEEFRHLWVQHELFEFCQCQGCEQASAMEFGTACALPVAERLEYFALRRTFFRQLVSYARSREQYTLEQRTEFEWSQCFWERICKEHSIPDA